MHGAAHAPGIVTPAPPSGWAPSADHGHAPPRPSGLDRFTLLIALGATALVALVFVLVLGLPKAAPLDEARPGGVAHNYYLALSENDLAKAYAYLSLQARQTLTYEEFAARVREWPERRGIRIDDERIEGNTATVTVRTMYALPPGPIPLGASERSIKRTVVLRREDGVWRIAPPLTTTHGPYEPYDPSDWFRW
ncbi:MAG TPA: hypothetical protein VFN74_19550 [Chloroflexota bacterium]|jgi:hypothetical protein|nr:hypothetical protein [Chloroflexota bacterium]